MIDLAFRQREGTVVGAPLRKEGAGQARGNELAGKIWRVADSPDDTIAEPTRSPERTEKTIDNLRIRAYHRGAMPSASNTLPLQLTTKMIQPPLQPVILPSAVPMLTDRARVMLQSLYALLDHAARRYFAPVKRLEVSGFRSYEDDSQEIVVTLYVDLPAQSALDFWDSVSLLEEEWTRKLPSDLAQISLERLSIAVRWEWDAFPV